MELMLHVFDLHNAGIEVLDWLNFFCKELLFIVINFGNKLLNFN